MIRLTTYAEAREAYRNKELRQALYDEGRALMDGVIVNLHGEAHLARRRLENRLFRRDTFAWYEAEVIPAIVAEVLAPAIRNGGGDLLVLSRRTMLTLALEVAGVDRYEVAGTPAGEDELDAIYALMDRLARASTVAHATGDKAGIIADGDRALAEFVTGFFEASCARRRALVDAFETGSLPEDGLPRDVLTTLLRNQDRLELPAATIEREIAYFPWVGSHSTSNQLVHAMHHLFDWIERSGDHRRMLTTDTALRQRFVHESMRLHPASPVSLRWAETDIELRSGRRIEQGSLVAIDLVAANRDPAVFGDDADLFDPYRELPDEVAPWGLSFGHGVHACLGQELAGGVADSPATPSTAVGHLFGSVTVMAGALLAAGAERDAGDPPEVDRSTTREVFGRYPVVFAAASA